MRIIELYNHVNCGTPATLNMLKELFRAESRSFFALPHPDNDMPETFEYKKMIVFVATGGDTYDIVGRNCRYFKANGCDTVFTASRTK